MRIVYLIGEPGIGKSTALALALSDMNGIQHDTPVPHIVYDGGTVVEVGRRRETFSGTDALAMSAINVVEPWVLSRPHPLIVGEGDRLACDRFFIAAASVADLSVVYLNADPRFAEERRRERGSQQNASWVAGRATKAAKLAERWATHEIDASYPVFAVADIVRTIINTGKE